MARLLKTTAVCCNIWAMDEPGRGKGWPYGLVIGCRMRYRYEISPRKAALIICAAVLVSLVYAEGWTWPLKAAAVILPVSLLVG